MQVRISPICRYISFIVLWKDIKKTTEKQNPIYEDYHSPETHGCFNKLENVYINTLWDAYFQKFTKLFYLLTPPKERTSLFVYIFAGKEMKTET